MTSSTTTLVGHYPVEVTENQVVMDYLYSFAGRTLSRKRSRFPAYNDKLAEYDQPNVMFFTTSLVTVHDQLDIFPTTWPGSEFMGVYFGIWVKPTGRIELTLPKSFWNAGYVDESTWSLLATYSQETDKGEAVKKRTNDVWKLRGYTLAVNSGETDDGTLEPESEHMLQTSTLDPVEDPRDRMTEQNRLDIDFNSNEIQGVEPEMDGGFDPMNGGEDDDDGEVGPVVDTGNARESDMLGIGADELPSRNMDDAGDGGDGDQNLTRSRPRSNTPKVIPSTSTTDTSGTFLNLKCARCITKNSECTPKEGGTAHDACSSCTSDHVGCSLCQSAYWATDFDRFWSSFSSIHRLLSDSNASEAVTTELESVYKGLVQFTSINRGLIHYANKDQKTLINSVRKSQKLPKL